MDLFEHQHQGQNDPSAPLAHQLRPLEPGQFLGWEKLVAPGKPLYQYFHQGKLSNFIFWGDPGSGKTTMAQLMAGQKSHVFLSLSALELGTREIKEQGEAARRRKLEQGVSTLLFVDEIHRLNRTQQDHLLPYTERGDFYLVGATTENPSYRLQRALLSRSRVVRFEPLSDEELRQLAERTFGKTGTSWEKVVSAEALERLLESSQGDARSLINSIEFLVHQPEDSLPLKVEDLGEVLGKVLPLYDQAGDEHYNVISAFIKSLRGSDADASVYYLARMLKGGEDPLFIARRLIIFASEDVGNADRAALPLATAGLQAVEAVGLPEAAINLAHVTTYLASCPKSNRSYMALLQAQAEVEKTGALPLPLHLQTPESQRWKVGEEKSGPYKYPHNFPRAWVEQSYLPEQLKDKRFYEPSNYGLEKNLKELMQWRKGDPKDAGS